MKPLVSIDTIAAAGETPDGSLRLDVRDAGGNPGIVQFGPNAMAPLRQALDFVAAASRDGEVPTIRITGSEKIALNDGGYGLLLDVAGGTKMLVRIPEANVSRLRRQLADLEALVAPQPGRTQ